MRVALVLAAGGSRRFGRHDKLAAIAAGRTLLDHALANARASGAQRILLVTAPARASPPRLQGVERVTARDARRGMSASLCAGLKALRPIDRELLIFLGDMPFARARNRVRIPPGCDAVRPGVRGAPGHPLLVRTAAARWAMLGGDRGFAASLDPARIATTPGGGGNLYDVDTRFALRRLRHRIAGAQGSLRLR